MPDQTFTPGAQLTAAQMNAIEKFLPSPQVATSNVASAVAGTLYQVRPAGGGTVTITLPSPVSGTTIGMKLDSTSGTAILNHNATELIYAPLTSSGGSRGTTSMTLGLPDEYVVVVADGSNWHVIARPTAATVAVSATIATSESTTSTTYTDLTTVGPAKTIQTLTTAIVIVGGNLANATGNGTAQMSFAVSGASTIAASDTNAFIYEAYLANAFHQGSYAAFISGLTSGSNTFTAKYKVGGSGGTATFFNRSITVIPLSV